MKFLTISFALVIALASSGCGTSSALPGQSPTSNPVGNIPQKSSLIAASPFPTEDLLQPGTSEGTDSASTPSAENQLVQLAKQDLAQRLNIDVGQISLLKITAITWSNISLGCSPMPGQILTQGSVSGYQIQLEAEGQEFIYHAGLNGRLIPCQNMNPGANNPLLFRTPGLTPPPQNANP